MQSNWQKSQKKSTVNGFMRWYHKMVLWSGIRRWYYLKACGLYYKTIMIVIYDCNDSGQYYNTRITIVIDDTSLSLCRQLQS